MRFIELRSGVKGVFKVSVDGRLVFDKAKVGHLPGPGEVEAAVEKRLGPRLDWRGEGKA